MTEHGTTHGTSVFVSMVLTLLFRDNESHTKKSGTVGRNARNFGIKAPPIDAKRSNLARANPVTVFSPAATISPVTKVPSTTIANTRSAAMVYGGEDL